MVMMNIRLKQLREDKEVEMRLKMVLSMLMMKVLNKYALFMAVNAEDDTTDNAERGEGVGNQLPEDVIDANDVEDVPLDDERQDSDGLHSVDDSGSECDEKVIYHEFNEEADRDDPKFEKGLKFRDDAQLREAVWSHSIKHGAHFIKLKMNEKWKISSRCENNCPWRLENPNCKVAWLMKRYVDKFSLNPSMPITTFVETVKEERMVEIHIKTAYRVRAQCLKILEGSNLDQYTKLWEYYDALRRTNPGSTIHIKVLPYDDAYVIFQRIYICLGACKNGFKNGCRQLVGLDGCHLKGVFKGPLLFAVGMNANNQTPCICYSRAREQG
ncbi:uncharacterized protein [Malus domestica]|uniref:uncharacterized protein n=1 Tax=Malus domestica TaxID=3750 RepID=UPI003974760C